MAEAQIESMMSQIYYGDDTTAAPDSDLILFEHDCCRWCVYWFRVVIR